MPPINKTYRIKKYWEEQAERFKTSPLATVPDRYYRDLEISRLLEYLPDGAKILDVGCGNGFSTIKFLKRLKRSQAVGVDYSPAMVAAAGRSLKRQPALKDRLRFLVGDVLLLSSLPTLRGKKFDVIVSERCLINLKNWPEQQAALREMKKLLAKNGRIVLCENTRAGLERLNKLRRAVALPPIAVRWHNFYFPEAKLLAFLKKNFRFVKAENIGSLYYIISRVVYAKLCALSGREPSYLDPINKIAARLPSVGEFSANYIFVLKNK